MAVPFSFDATHFDCSSYTDEHEAWRDALKKFVASEMTPHIEAWEETEEIPLSLHKKASEFGLIGMGYPSVYGGLDQEIDIYHQIIVSEELSRPGAGGLPAGLLTHGIGLPPIVALGSDEMKDFIVPDVLRGEKIICLGITEPSGGSDVASLKTTAKKEGADYIVNGSKTYITSGMRADYITAAVRTGGEGASGVSLLLIDMQSQGVSRHKLRKMGWRMSDTAEIYFDNVRVPATNLIGTENQGFMGIMLNFNTERITMAAQAIAFARVCLEEASEWASQRETFGRPLMSRQVIRHKMADMMMRIRACQAYLHYCASQFKKGTPSAGDIALLKVNCSQTMEFCAREAMQIIGGASYMQGSRVERIYREVRVNAIGGGSEEIMKELALRQFGA